MITEDLEPTKEEQRDWPGHWAMSGIGGCPRSLILEAMDFPATRGSKRVMDEGVLHEVDLLRRLALNPKVTMDEYPDGAYHKDHPCPCVNTHARHDQIHVQLQLNGQTYPVIGHMDGVITVSEVNYGLEIKSMGPFIWPKLKKNPMIQQSFPGYYAQIQSYMNGIQLLNLFFIVKNRGNGDIHEAVFRYDHPYIENLIHTVVEPAMNIIEKKASPDSLACHEKEEDRKYCPYRHICEAGGNVTDAPTNLKETISLAEQKEELTTAVGNWKQGKKLEEEGKELTDESKAIFRRYLKDAGVDKATLDGILMNLIKSERTGTDWEKLKEYLTEEQLESVKKKSHYTQFRVTGDY